MAAPAVHHLSHAPTPYRASSLPQQLKRLAYVVSIILGGGAVFAGLWSAFLLPLLHATYSARNALALPQSERWSQLVEKLKGIRELAIFPVRSEEETRALVRAHKAELASQASQVGEEETEEKDGEEGEEKDGERKLLTAPDDSPKSASISLAETAEESVAPPPTTSQLHADPSVLGPALRELASSMEATATTRTSLLSTLEGYTSGLHRELFLSRGANSSPWSKGTSSVGLGTLSANLAKAGGNTDSPLGLPAAKSEEWDAVRREVRAIKGILLNRRNFAPARPVH
ncbi:hypothetical protein A1Q2_07062 [Trichosporon asahii var. asahii CBS 8904]|uniref:Peroxin-14 n=1 Tax=Trichosporon asahii var. asahii (strain CBS 8904) TaxID=1220162 RepID=K1VD11_TRIAC|nr:hypothetical protein A1Q2_07062 [Trichosporon asahii var. asahii CBS 8904]